MAEREVRGYQRWIYVGTHSAPNKCYKWNNQNTTEIMERHGNTLAGNESSNLYKQI